MANIASGDFGIRGKISDIKRFIDDAKSYRFRFDLKNFENFNIDDEIVDTDENGRVKIYLTVDHRWRIDIEEAKAISKEYNLNLWIEAFELYLGFREEVCIIGGNVVYSDYVEWDYYQGEW